MADKLTWVAIQVVRTTPGANGAVLVSTGDENSEAWIPRSQINDHSTDHGENLDEDAWGKDIEIEIPEWLATREGLV